MTFADYGGWLLFGIFCLGYALLNAWRERQSKRQHAHTFEHVREEYRPDPRSSHFGALIDIDSCACGETREVQRGGFCNPSQAALSLITVVAMELDKPSPNLVWTSDGTYGMPRCGSGWIMELPAVLSYLIDTRGEDYARRQLIAAFAAGSSRVITAPVLGY